MAGVTRSVAGGVTPVEIEERRYFVLKVGNKRQKNIPYFKALCDQMNNGGRAALLHMLLGIDLDKHTVAGKPFEVRRAPHTAALQDQQQRTRGDVDALIEDMCTTGHVPCACSDPELKMVSITSGEEDGQGFDRNQASDTRRRD